MQLLIHKDYNLHQLLQSLDVCSKLHKQVLSDLRSDAKPNKLAVFIVF
jgi:hypothetical protein